MIEVIPLDSTAPEYRVRVRLDGSFYFLTAKWNTRRLWWTIDMLDSNGDALVRGLRVCTGYDLLRAHKLVGFPPGALVAIDTRRTKTDPSRDDLGLRVVLCYIPAADMQEAA